MVKIPVNYLRKRLQKGLPTVATRILSTWPVIAEAAASSGNFDYLEFAAEYAPFTQIDLENLVRAMELHGVGSMIKVDFQNRFYVAQRAMASGFQAILLTDHKTAEEVAETIRMLKPDTPQLQGRLGYPSRRWIGYTPNLPQMQYAQMAADTVIAVMIEKDTAMDQIEKICSLPAVDMVQFGPSDYAMSRGWNLEEHLEEIRIVEERMIRVALEHHVYPRCEIDCVEQAEHYLALGVRHFSIGDELRTNMSYWKNVGGSMRQIVENL